MTPVIENKIWFVISTRGDSFSWQRGTSHPNHDCTSWSVVTCWRHRSHKTIYRHVDAHNIRDIYYESLNTLHDPPWRGLHSTTSIAAQSGCVQIFYPLKCSLMTYSRCSRWGTKSSRGRWCDTQYQLSKFKTMKSDVFIVTRQCSICCETNGAAKELPVPKSENDCWYQNIYFTSFSRSSPRSYFCRSLDSDIL